MRKFLGLLTIGLSLAVETSAGRTTVTTEYPIFMPPLRDGLGLNGSSDNYAVLEKLFMEGTVPSGSDVVGWYSGRCYAAAERARPTNDLLAGSWDTSGENHGPLFPGNGLKLFSVHYFGKPADIFDHFTPSLELELQSFLESPAGYGSVTEASINDGALSFWFNGNTKWQVRRSSTYLVSRWLDERGGIHGYCYYFKKVK